MVIWWPGGGAHPRTAQDVAGQTFPGPRVVGRQRRLCLDRKPRGRPGEEAVAEFFGQAAVAVQAGQQRPAKHLLEQAGLKRGEGQEAAIV